MRSTVLLAATGALLLAGCNGGQPTQAQVSAEWALRSASPVAAPVDCIERARISGTTARDDRTVDFAMDDGRTLRNRMPASCAGLFVENRFIQRTALERLCSTDTIELVRRDGRPGGACGLGMFQEVRIPPREPALR